MAASYREAIAWIALNDGNGDAEWLDIEHVSEMVSVALISSIFKKTQEEVGKAVIRYRKKAYGKKKEKK
jgi:hypothetical protein